MKQQTEETQDGIKHGRRSRRAVFAVAIAALALLAVPVLAWLYMQRSMETVTKINMPYSLFIGAGDAQAIQQMELSNIDVSGGAGEKEVVFCVFGTREEKTYHLQMAHTTNIGFKYTIYKASRSENGEISYLGKQYEKETELAGKYLNQDKDKDTYHSITYGEYAKVQGAAEPLYWKTNEQETLPGQIDDTGFYVNYYVLHISWDATVQNNKETDMIYLMVG